MTTATTTSPLESFQHGRDNFLAVVLDGMSGLETSVLEFMHQHERQARATGTELADALRDKARLENQLGEQALELEASRTHVCATPETGDFFAGDDAEETAPVTAPAAADAAGDEEAVRTIAELRAALEAEQRVSAGLRADLATVQDAAAGLRVEIGKLDDSLDTVEGKLREAKEAHTRFAREIQETFDQRLAEGVRAAETGIRGEAVRIIEAIAADNPALAEAADLFTVAFPAEASAEAEAPAPAEDPQDGAAAPEAPEAAAAPQPAAEPDWEQAAAAPAPTADDFYNALPAPGPEDAPELLTQPLMAAPDLGDDAILDPNFFDNPEPLEAPAGEPVQAPAPAEDKSEVPKPGYGLFGRKKEAQNV